MPHWSCAYVGRPYVDYENDCGEFVRLVMREIFKREVNIPTERWYASEAGRARLRSMAAQVEHALPDVVSPVDQPTEGDCVLMRSGSAVIHIGVYCEIDGEGWVLHAVERARQVILTRVRELEAKRFPLSGFYRWI